MFNIAMVYFVDRVEWYCHFDDDVYVNVKELSKLLSQYNSSKPYYIGKNPKGPDGVKVGYVQV